MKQISKALLILSVSTLLTKEAQSQIFIKETITGNGSGSSWDNAAPGSNLTTLLTNAGNKTLYIAAGNYILNSNVTINGINFYMKGGFPANANGTDTSAYNATLNRVIISETTSSAALRRFNISSAAGTTYAHFEGLEFTNFNNTGAGVFDIGGGSNATIQLKNITAYNNIGSDGGFMNVGSFTGTNKSITIDYSSFINNTSTGYGGAFYLATVYINPPGINTGVQGGGPNHIFSVTNSSIRNNKSSNWGGVFFLTTVADVYVYNNNFCIDNSAGSSIASHGGIMGWTTTNRMTFANNTFAGGRINGAAYGGSAIFSQAIYPPGNIISGNIFYDNNGTAGNRPDIYVMDLMNLTLSNNYFDKANQAAWLEGPSTSSVVSTGNISNNQDFNPLCPTTTTPLAINNLDFKAVPYNKGAQLSWSIKEEQDNVVNYEVQRSYDGKNFESIGFVKYNNNHQYNYIDFDAIKSITYYRLVQHGVDNESLLSRVITVVTKNNVDFITLNPNPSNSVVYINGLSGFEYIEMYNITGQKILEINVGDYNNASINVQNIAAGVYYVRIQNEMGTLKTLKLSVTK
jgi:predicted outer membrane repeat protein